MKVIETLAKDLEAGVAADVWYDAAHHMDEPAQEVIERTQMAMTRAAQFLVDMASLLREVAEVGLEDQALAARVRNAVKWFDDEEIPAPSP